MKSNIQVLNNKNDILAVRKNLQSLFTTKQYGIYWQNLLTKRENITPYILMQKVTTIWGLKV